VTLRTPPAETRLLADARGGSDTARSALFQQHHAAAWRTALAITRDPHLADDIAQEALVIALERLDRFDGRGTFAGWLHRIVANRSLNALRRRPTASADDLPDRQAPVLSAGIDPDLRVAFDRLSADQRAILVLRYWYDLRPGEIAEALHMAEGTVHSRLHRALAKLRGHLEGLP
jgi:RNA polymerase sigma-70 factor (ECF subfamily)